MPVQYNTKTCWIDNCFFSASVALLRFSLLQISPDLITVEKCISIQRSLNQSTSLWYLVEFSRRRRHAGLSVSSSSSLALGRTRDATSPLSLEWKRTPGNGCDRPLCECPSGEEAARVTRSPASGLLLWSFSFSLSLSRWLERGDRGPNFRDLREPLVCNEGTAATFNAGVIIRGGGSWGMGLGAFEGVVGVEGAEDVDGVEGVEAVEGVAGSNAAGIMDSVTEDGGVISSTPGKGDRGGVIASRSSSSAIMARVDGIDTDIDSFDGFAGTNSLCCGAGGGSADRARLRRGPTSSAWLGSSSDSSDLISKNRMRRKQISHTAWPRGTRQTWQTRENRRERFVPTQSLSFPPQHNPRYQRR